VAAGPTYTPIATTTLGSATSNITFTSISGSYTDLIIAGGLRLDNDSSGAQNAIIRFNGDSGSNYSYNYLLGDGSSAGSGRGLNETSLLISTVGNDNTNRYSSEIWQINNYSNTTTYKSALLKHMVNFGNQVQTSVGLWNSTSAITSISITPGGSKNWAAGSILTLYGIAAA
jgi:hypothetical protein